MRILVLLISCISSVAALAQTPAVQWSRYYHKPSDPYSYVETIYDGKRTTDKGYIFAGYDSGYNFNPVKAWNKTNNGMPWIAKADSNGVINWRETGNNWGVDYVSDGALTSVEQITTGDYIAAGYGAGHGILTRFSIAGTRLWTKKFGGGCSGWVLQCTANRRRWLYHGRLY